MTRSIEAIAADPKPEPARSTTLIPESSVADAPSPRAAGKTRTSDTDFFSPAADYDTAIDRLTADLAVVLKERKVLLVWVVDRSESMADDRDALASRLWKINDKIPPKQAGGIGGIRYGVVGYGRTAAIETPDPIDDYSAVKSAIRAITTDLTDGDNQCDGIETAVRHFRKFADAEDRQMVLALATDESGDASANLTQLEQTIAAIKAAHGKVYVFGREAVFGTQFAHLLLVDPENRKNVLKRFDRGPETAEHEQLQINGFHRRIDAFPSGFGPYEQMRMARETGGRFLMLPSPERRPARSDPKAYDAAAMRPFLPDLGPRSDYIAERHRSPFRQAIFRVIADLNPYQTDSDGENFETRTADFPILRTEFAKEAVIAKRQAEGLMGALAKAQKSLEAVEALRYLDRSPRWRANYDLIYAQVIIYQIRLKEYRWYLEEFEKNPKAALGILAVGRPTTGWTIRVVRRLLKPEATETQRTKAEELLRSLQRQYAGTPWGELAKYEAERGFGVELVHYDLARSPYANPEW